MPECELLDGTTRIFLCTKGENQNEVSEELIEFLHYLENTTEETAIKLESERVKRIHERVCKVRTSEEVGVKYLQAWEEKYFAKLEAREEGLEEGRAEGRLAAMKDLVAKKLAKGKSVEEIAEDLEETVEAVERLINEQQSDAD